MDYPKCPNCSKQIVDTDEIAVLEVNITPVVHKRIFLYCSKICAEAILANPNSKSGLLDPTLKIDKTEILSEKYPFKLAVWLSEVERKIIIE